MKRNFFIGCLLLLAFGAAAQSKDERALVARTYQLSHTVFGTKDSATVQDLFARQLTYGHSSGKVETRQEALNGIIYNQSTYSDTAVSNIHVLVENPGVAIVRHLFSANEHKADGTVAPLHFSMMLVWVKEAGQWRLMGRQAVKLVDKK